MAPPPNRRPGYSRRAQYGLFVGYVAAVLGIFAGLGLILVARIDPPGFAILRGAMLDLTAPLSTAGRAGMRGAAEAAARVGDWWRAGERNEALRRELAVARRLIVDARITAAENGRLRRLARLVDAAPQRVATARIVASTLGDTRRLATITAGSAAGVRPGQPVRSAEGLVGRVFEAGRFAARIVLLSDGGSVVPVRLLRDGSAALAAGRGDGTVELRPLSAGANPFRRGDIVVTSGIGGLFPPGIGVALVTQRRDDVAIARPLADPATLDFVIVERAYAPPPPPPSPPPPRGAPAR